MNVRLICCTVVTAMLLCACQASVDSPDITEDLPVLEQPEQEAPPSDDRVEEKGTEEDDNLFPPAPPVCELDFTETESFPLPFEDELLVIGGELYLSTEQALYDYDTMWQLLEENYPYFEAIKRELGIDWEEVKAEYRRILEGHASHGHIRQPFFIQTIDSCLREFQSVGHLFLVSAQSRAALLDNFKNAEDAPEANLFKILNNSKSELFYEYARRFLGSDGSNTFSDSKKSESVSIEGLTAITDRLFTGYAGGRVPYLKITSFNHWDDVAQAKLEDFFSSISYEEHLIIDVRGNQGGDEDDWRSGIVPFLAQQEYEFNWFWGAKSGALNLIVEPELDKNQWKRWARSITRYTDDSWQKEFSYISPDTLTDIDIFLKASVTSRCADVPDKFHGKIWMLVDKYSYSATDSLACFCKETGFATLVGTKTGGNGKSGTPYFMALPYSGLIVEYEPYLSFNTDGSCNGTSGTAPDIVSEEGSNALETCLMAINGKLSY